MCSVAFSPDGSTLASGSRDGSVKLWDVSAGREVVTVGPDHGGVWVRSVAFSADGRSLACGAGTGVLIYDFHAYDEDIERWLREAGVEADIGGR